MANKIQQIIQQSRKSWFVLIQATAWIVAVIASFVLPPPIGTSSETRIWVRFAQFVITILIGLLMLVALKRNRKKDTLGWGATAATFLLLGTICFFAYQILATRWTASYANERVLIGRDYTKDATKYRQDNPTVTSADLLMHAAGQVEKIWTVE